MQLANWLVAKVTVFTLDVFDVLNVEKVRQSLRLIFVHVHICALHIFEWIRIVESTLSRVIHRAIVIVNGPILRVRKCWIRLAVALEIANTLAEPSSDLAPRIMVAREGAHFGWVPLLLLTSVHL